MFCIVFCFLHAVSLSQELLQQGPDLSVHLQVKLSKEKKNVVPKHYEYIFP